MDSLLLAVFDVVFLHEFSCDTARKFVNFKTIIPEDLSFYYSGIIPDSPIIPKIIPAYNVRMPIVLAPKASIYLFHDCCKQ